VEALGRRALPLRVDVRDERTVEEAVAETMKAFGRIDFLVNNAGALHWRPMTESPMKKFDLVMGVNARGAYACTLAVLPHMIAAKYGHIVMMSPPVQPEASAGKIAYAISKFGMTLIAHGLAEEVRVHNVACNALWPATMIESYATINWSLGGPAVWRKADILADATVAMLAKEPATFTGRALVDEDFLRDEGVEDFTKYRCDPNSEPPKIGFNFRVSVGGQ
jgi:citronellol/citronellal dehydrogenase